MSEPVMGNDSWFLAPDDYKHFLQVIDWAFTTRDNSLNKMRTEGMTLLAKVEQQKGLVNTFQTVVDIGSSGGSGGGTKITSLPYPTPFNGREPSTSKRTMQFETWRSQITTRWLLRPQEFPNEVQRILYA
jgi:hypothetical protein